MVQAYDFDGVDELENRWTSEGDGRLTIRELADHFNIELLAQALYQKAISVLDREAANYYILLTKNDISSGTRIQVENRLEHHSIDGEKQKKDFITR